MSKKDYERIARALNKARNAPGVGFHAIDAIDLAAENVADELGLENPRFDRRRFRAAVRQESVQ